MRRCLPLLALMIFSAIPVRTQVVAVYVTSSSNRFSNVQTGSTQTNSGYQEQYASFWTSGIGGGITLNLLPVGPVRLGFDLRGSSRPGTVGADTAMGGLKLAFSPPLLRIKPYLQASGGYVATRTVNLSTGTGGGSFNNKYAAWEVFGGIDVPLMAIIDWRVLEVGGGTGLNVGLSSNVPSLSMFSINSGLVVHF